MIWAVSEGQIIAGPAPCGDEFFVFACMLLWLIRCGGAAAMVGLYLKKSKLLPWTLAIRGLLEYDGSCT